MVVVLAPQIFVQVTNLLYFIKHVRQIFRQSSKSREFSFSCNSHNFMYFRHLCELSCEISDFFMRRNLVRLDIFLHYRNLVECRIPRRLHKSCLGESSVTSILASRLCCLRCGNIASGPSLTRRLETFTTSFCGRVKIKKTRRILGPLYSIYGACRFNVKLWLLLPRVLRFFTCGKPYNG